MRRIIRAIQYVVLVLVALALLASGIWLSRPVSTGAGDLSRLRVGEAYYKLARTMPGYCQEGYVFGVVGSSVSSTAIAFDKAVDLPWIITPPGDEGSIRLVDVPGESWRLFVKSLDELFHSPASRCAIPRPQQWTPDLIGS